MEPDQALNYAYYNTDSPACFTGIKTVYEEALRHCPTLDEEYAEKWMEKQRTYTLCRPTRSRFLRLRTVPTGLNTDWQADLALFNALKDYNDGYVYILVCIDVLSRKLYAEPVKKKDSTHMMPAFDAIFERAGTLPWKIFTDRGGEFESQEMKRYFERKDVLKFAAVTNKVQKASVAERANRTLKDRLYKYFLQNNTLRWVDVLQKIVDAINHSVCRMTGMRPVDVTEENAPELRRRLYPDQRHVAPRRTRFRVGDAVRIVKKKALFTKGLARYSDVIYYIEEVLAHKRPVVYRLRDYFGQSIPGYFYEKELAKTVPFDETTTRIGGIERYRTHNGVREARVHWLNHPTSYDSWIPADQLAGQAPAVDRNIQI